MGENAKKRHTLKHLPASKRPMWRFRNAVEEFEEKEFACPKKHHVSIMTARLSAEVPVDSWRLFICSDFYVPRFLFNLENHVLPGFRRLTIFLVSRTASQVRKSSPDFAAKSMRSEENDTLLRLASNYEVELP